LILRWHPDREGNLMSQAPKSRPKVPEGRARYYTTKQMAPNEKGFVGYETVWDSLQKEVEYKKPKRP
jgi:hypothetical protein